MKYNSNKKSTVKRTNNKHISLSRILFIAGILITLLIISSNVAVAANAPANAQDQNQNPNAAPKNKVLEKMELNKKRIAAAGGLEALFVPPTPPTTVGEGPGGKPHYYGPYPNYANSPAPNIIVTFDGPNTTVGNALNERTHATDSAPVFIVIPSAVLPAGRLINFTIWNQAGSGPNTFYAYVLRPTGTLNQYTIVFNSSLLTVPAGTSEIATFDVSAALFEVQAGDVIGFYGKGIPFNTSVNSAPTPPANDSTITLGVDAGFPIYPEYRDYAMAATVQEFTTTLEGGLRKFVDPLPDIPIAIPNTTAYLGSDYYEIELGQYTKKMHSDLPPTTLRGYRQTNTNDPVVSQFHYLGPMIISKRDRPVRIKFTNSLPTGAGGDLFLPVDTTIMGAGPYEINYDPVTKTTLTTPNRVGNFTQNRATIHLHGGFVPWISDGTPHQWITPAGDPNATNYSRGVSAAYVPDMWYDANGNPVTAGTPGATNYPGDGNMTFYYNNQQSARLQFYHDHSFGITRLNVYAGEAAGYLITDDVEGDMINGTNNTGINPDLKKVIPDIGIPLVIQDKTFVDNTTIGWQDPTWNWGTGDRYSNGTIMKSITGDLWLPHVYMPNQNPSDPSGMNAFGRWHYSPYFFPAPTDIINGPIPNPYCKDNQTIPGADCIDSAWPLEHTVIPDVPNPSFAMEAFMDTPVINGVAYPNLTVEPQAYRFRILNAANDRFFNLQMYVADPAVTTYDGRTNTEVRMVPAIANPTYPEGWPIDGRDGGVPDPATRGPSFIQIGTEGGFLPEPVELPNKPVDWNVDPTTFDAGLVNQGTLILGPAERADVIVDFSQFAGKTIILYNDAPAPWPAIDARYDSYTGNPDLRDIGGPASTLAGYGPNTRTMMQIKVNATTAAQAYDIAVLKAVFAKTAVKRGVFEVSQDEILVAQKAYETAYDTTYPPDQLVGINDKYKNFTSANGTRMNITFQNKAIQDETSETYSVLDGRMSALLGLTVPGIPGFIPFPFLSPPVEIIKDSVYGTPLGSLGDGTQIWKITHNGVDTHPIHVHLFNAQVINRVAWDNAYRPIDLNEAGWKETIRVNPLQDTIIAFRAVAPTQPFRVPNSIRPLDPTMPTGMPLSPPPMGWKDPTGAPLTTIMNHMVNYGWEYMYHCHILGHEEMDMMHGVSLGVAPDAPTNLNGNNETYGPPRAPRYRVRLTWTDNSTNEIAFIVQKKLNTSSTWTNITVTSTTGPTTGTTVTYVENDVARGTYDYCVFARNVVGDTATVNFPTLTLDSAPTYVRTVIV